jgi:hypothetical protein
MRSPTQAAGWHLSQDKSPYDQGRMGRAGVRRGFLVVVLMLLGVGAGLVSGAATAVGQAAAGRVTPAGASTPSDPGNNSSYALVDNAGGVMTFGGAGYGGDTLALSLQKPVVGAAPNPGGGYWLVASDGGIFTFGKAQFWGSTGGTKLNQPIVGMAATPDGMGYWLVASDGGIFAFGNAQFWGSTGGIKLNKPIVGMAATPSGLGYWLVASDGGIFAFGDAQFFGSTGGLNLNAPISGMAATPDGLGYWLVGQDAGVFTFGDAQFAGSAQTPLHPPLFPSGFSYTIPSVVAIMPDAPGPQATHQGKLRVAFAGDSLGFYEGEYTTGTNPPYLTDDGAAPGCGFTNGAPIDPWSDPGSVYLSPQACALWAQQLAWLTDRFHPDVTVIQLGFWECQDRLYQGNYQTLADGSYAAYIQSNLEQAVQIAHSDGGSVILNTSPYFNDGTPSDLVSDFNNIVNNVVSQNSSFVTVFNVNSLLDPNGVYAPVVDGVLARTPDGVHVTEAGVQIVMDPPLNQIINNVGPPVYQGSA